MRRREALQRLIRRSPLLQRLNPAFGRKVFGIGVPKTGTKSLGAALGVLGYRVFTWHGDSADFTLRWHEGLFTPEMKLAVQSYDAFEDLPWPLLFEELDRLEPEARFVLTVRASPERWLESMQRHVARLPPWVGHYLVYGSYDPLDDAELYLRFYSRHLERVRAHFRDRPDKLLELCLERGEGWPELCTFLGRGTVPNVAFPHLNEGSQPGGDGSQGTAQSDDRPVRRAVLP